MKKIKNKSYQVPKPIQCQDNKMPKPEIVEENKNLINKKEDNPGIVEFNKNYHKLLGMISDV